MVTLNSAADQLHQAWNIDGDADVAERLARSVLATLLCSEAADLSEAFHAAESAGEVFWDRNLTEPAGTLARRTRELVFEQRNEISVADYRALQVRAHTFSARTLHRCLAPLPALGHVTEARRILCEDAGSLASLRQHAEASAPDEVSASWVGLVGIGIPASRAAAARTGWSALADFRDQWIDFGLGLTRDGHRPPYGPRAFAVVSQLLLALLDRPYVASDLPQIRRLRGLECELRPAHARAQATRRLVDMAAARWCGDQDAEHAHAHAALHDMVEAGLRRHPHALTARGHWPLREIVAA